MNPVSVTIALASPRPACTIQDGLEKIERSVADASQRGARIVCFPEAYLPGLRGQDFPIPAYDRGVQEGILQTVSDLARTHRIAVILGMELVSPAGTQIAAVVIEASGRIAGHQTKNQLAPEEERYYVPGFTRRLFYLHGLDGLKFGIAICHEGWRYPETVRWAAVRGAHIVFHPQHTGADTTGVRLSEWGSATAPYYEKAMICRSIENSIYFASVNYALRYQESATSLIAPSGECQAYLPYGEEGVLIQEIRPALATGLIASRFAPGRYADELVAEQQR